MKFKRTVIKAMVAAIALVGIGVPGIAGVQAANAAVVYRTVASPSLNARSGPGTGYDIVGSFPYGTSVTIVCQTQGGTNVGGNATWDKLSNNWWIADYWTTSPSFNSYIPGIGPCTTSTPPPSTGVGERAAEWAQAHLGQVYTNLIPSGYWSGYCESFVNIAYGGRFLYGSAWSHFLAWQAAGYIHGGVPPRGAVVFYNIAPYGHDGIAIGNGQIISTYGFSNNRLPVQQHAYNYFPGYVGWAMPYG